MQQFQGKPLSPGLAWGKAHVMAPSRRARVERDIDQSDVPAELVRFEGALLRSTEELNRLKEHVCQELGQTESGIFEAHLGMLNDPAFIKRCRDRVRNELVCIEHAIDKEIEELERVLADVESEFIRERTHDLHDIRIRLQKHLQSGTTAPLSKVPRNSVIVASELLPSDTVELDRKNVVAIVTECGGSAAHATILARALGSPLITGINGFAQRVHNGDTLQVNALTGKVIVNPTIRQRRLFRSFSEQYQNVSQEAQENGASACSTEDGREILFYANISNRQDVGMVSQHNLAGIGLLRTECLFLNQPQPPTLRQHLRHYSFVKDQLGEKPAVIRTLDLGGDKVPLFLEGGGEKNPVIGMRGLRYSLSEERMFKTQLKAIARCRHEGANLSVLFPMVLGAGDLDRAIQLLDDVLEKEGCSSRLPVGAMIETPSAVFQIEEVVSSVDFVTIGTNDLTQFILAADRESTDMLGEYSVLHPSVLRAIKRVIDVCQAMNKPCTICGEAAGDPATAALFVGMGITRLSMSPIRTARVQRLLKAVTHESMKQCAEDVPAARTALDVEKALTRVAGPAVRSQGLVESRYEFISQPHSPRGS